MDEIISRFEIVRLAVRLVDHDTVAVQIEKLKEICSDEDLSEIISLLTSKNFRQALYLMKAYVESLNDSFLEPTRRINKPKREVVEKPKEESQNLFDMMKTAERVIRLDDMVKMTEDSIEDTVGYDQAQFDAQAYISQAKVETQQNGPTQRLYKEVSRIDEVIDSKREHDILTDMDQDSPTQTTEKVPVCEESEKSKHLDEQVDIKKESTNQSEEKKHTISNESDETIGVIGSTGIIETDVLLENKEQPEPEESMDADIEPAEKDMIDSIAGEIIQIQDPLEVEKINIVNIDGENSTVNYVEINDNALNDLAKGGENQEFSTQEVGVGAVPNEVNYLEIGLDGHEIQDDNDDTVKGDSHESNSVKKEPVQKYSPISYIDQKFRNMRHQFPQIEVYENGIVPVLSDLSRQVATIGYTEDDIKELVRLYLNAKSNGRIAEAAQLLLFAASSESQYAQLILARELYTGEILKADYPEAFTQINRLAEHNYPDAVCDLGQLYEHGHGIKRDKKTAMLLYEEAAEMGVARAQKHFDRLTHKKGLFGSLFKKK